MSDSLSFADHLLARARLMVRLGRSATARRLLKSLVRHPGQPHRVRADAYRLLAEVEIDAGRFGLARRYLVGAIRLRRHADELYIEYARAVAADPDANPQLAVKAMRRAVGIDPFEPRAWAALGTAARHGGDIVLARKAYRRAARLRPGDFDVLAEIADGFVALGLEPDARRFVTGIRFRLSDRADVATLCHRVAFAVAARRQRHAKTVDDAATILPFPIPVGRPGDRGVDGPLLRVDRTSHGQPHLIRLFGNSRGPRQAN